MAVEPEVKPVPGNPSEAEPENNTTAPDPQIEREAVLQGWVPEDQFRGNPDDWVPAGTFVKRGREINPILRANNKRLMARMDEITRQNQELKSTLDAFGKHHEDTAAKAYKAALATLRKEKKDAIDGGDVAEALKLADQIDELKDSQAAALEASKPVVQPAPAPGTERDPSLVEWTKRNEWFGENKVKTNIVMAMGEDLHAEHPDLKGRPFLDELEDRLAHEFPTRFPEFGGNPNRQKQLTPDGGTPPRGGPRTKGRTFNDLPADAQAACKKFVAQKLLTTEQYLADYWTEDDTQ